MISSMTGYGDAESQLNGVTYMVEIKTVNNRYFKATIKTPEVAAFLEEDIERLLRRNLSRGTVTCVLRLRNASANELFGINEMALQTLMERLSRIASSAKITCPIDIGGLLNLPGILEPVLPDEKTAEKIKKTILEISQKAIEKLKQMRDAEGAALEADLKKHCSIIKQKLGQIRPRTAVVLQEYAEKLKKRINELLSGAKLKLEEETLAREVAVFAERSDISEEITRLDWHLQQLQQSCRTDGPVGRKLDFIAQEMLREANTIASKSSDTEITNCVVDIKCQIDRIKEQVQNVE